MQCGRNEKTNNLSRNNIVSLQLIGVLCLCVAPPPLLLPQTLHVPSSLLAVAMRTMDTHQMQEETPPMTSLPLWQGLTWPTPL